MNTQKRVFNKLAEVDKVELATQKVELAVGDELRRISSKTETLRKKLDSELEDAFEPIRRIEKIISNLSDKIYSFKAYKDSLMNMEKQYADDNSKIQNAEKELGVKIERPKALDVAVRELEEYQKLEETYRREINEFNRAVKKYK